MIGAGFFAGKKLLKVIAWAVVILVILGVILWGYFLIDEKGFDRGVGVTEAKWEKKHAAAMKLRADRIILLQKKVEKKEREFKAESDRINEIRVEDKENADRAKDMAIAAVLDGTFKLRDPNRTWNRAGRVCVNGGNTEGGTRVDGEGSDEETGSEFSIATTTFFVGEATRANANTEQLNSAIDRITLLERFCEK